MGAVMDDPAATMRMTEGPTACVPSHKVFMDSSGLGYYHPPRHSTQWPLDFGLGRPFVFYAALDRMTSKRSLRRRNGFSKYV
jgi:hypothetical protein